MLRKPEGRVQRLSRRAFVVLGTKIVAFGAVCMTIGGTILAACDSGTTRRGRGYGYGYGYGYGPRPRR